VNRKEIEVNARTVDEAVESALVQLGATKNQVEIDVVKKGRSGVLGVGAEEARVKVRFMDDEAEQGDIAEEAKIVLETLLNHLGLEAEIKIIQSEEDNQQITLNIEGDDLGVLIGRRGQALSSLQYMVKLIVAEKFKLWAPITVDIEGYKKRRYNALKNLALRVAEQVKTSRRSMNLEPMPADERRIIHLALAEHPDVSTHSIDFGERRKVVIQLRKHH
jgi:spoIIIJ-associated protein